MLSSVCDRRLCGGRAEDEGRSKAARVPTDGDATDLDTRGVKAGDRLFVLLAEHPAVRVHGEPTDRMRYGRRDLYCHKWWYAQGPGLSGPRGGETPARGDGSVVLLEGTRERFARYAPLPKLVSQLRKTCGLDDGSSRTPGRLDHLFGASLAHPPFEPGGIEDVPGVESGLVSGGQRQGCLRPVSALVGVAFAAGVDRHGVAAVELGDLNELIRGDLRRGSRQIAPVELVETRARERALLQRRPKTVTRAPRVRPHEHPSGPPDYVASDQLGVAGETS